MRFFSFAFRVVNFFVYVFYTKMCTALIEATFRAVPSILLGFQLVQKPPLFCLNKKNWHTHGITHLLAYLASQESSISTRVLKSWPLDAISIHRSSQSFSFFFGLHPATTPATFASVNLLKLSIENSKLLSRGKEARLSLVRLCFEAPDSLSPPCQSLQIRPCWSKGMLFDGLLTKAKKTSLRRS